VVVLQIRRGQVSSSVRRKLSGDHDQNEMLKDSDWQAFLDATQSWRDGKGCEAFNSLHYNLEKRAKQFKPSVLARFALEWRLPFNPLYLELAGFDLSNTDTNLFNRVKTILHRRGEGKVCWSCDAEHTPGERHFAAHEFWQWDDRRGVRRLASIHFLCRDCHHLTHHAYWCFVCLPQEKDIRLIELFCRVNDCSFLKAFAHVKWSYEMCNLRRRLKWTIDLSPISDLLAEAEENRKRH
jgi:hypothetical protein